MSKDATNRATLGTQIEQYLSDLIEIEGHSFEEVTAAANGVVMRAVGLKHGRHAAIGLCEETIAALTDCFRLDDGPVQLVDTQTGRC